MPHLTAGLPGLGYMVLNVQVTVQCQAPFQITLASQAARNHDSYSVAWSGAATQVGNQDLLHSLRVPHAAGLDVILQAEGVGMPANWEKGVRELEEADHLVNSHLAFQIRS
jgi:hypothetical protein